MPNIDDLLWLKESQVPEVFNELAASLLEAKPKDVYSYIGEWAARKAWAKAVPSTGRPPETPQGNNIVGSTTEAYVPPQRQGSVPNMSREVSGIIQSTFEQNVIGMPNPESLPLYRADSGVLNGFGDQQQSAVNAMFTGSFHPMAPLPVDDSADPGGTIPQNLSRTASSRRMSRVANSGVNTPQTEGLGGAGVRYSRPSAKELCARYSSPEGVYALQRCVGEGHYGKVYQAACETDGATYAVKKVTIDGDWVEQEIVHLQHCQSEYTVRLMGTHYHPGEDCLWIVMEMLSLSIADLAEILGPKAFDERMIACIAREVLFGLDVLHSLQRVHLDVKPGNILFTPDRLHIKIADFGTMQIVGDDCIQLGDFAFMSPEVAYSSGKYHSGSDLWSLAVTLLYLSDGEAPLWREKPDLLMFVHRETCMRPSLWDPLKWSPQFSQLLFSCFMKDPNDRPTAHDVLKSPWLCDNTAGLDLSCLPMPDAMPRAGPPV